MNARRGLHYVNIRLGRREGKCKSWGRRKGSRESSRSGVDYSNVVMGKIVIQYPAALE